MMLALPAQRAGVCCMQLHANNQPGYAYRRCKGARREARVNATKISTALSSAVINANSQWLHQALTAPVQLLEGRCHVTVVGVCFWAPEQQALVAEALSVVQPDEVLVEQPPLQSPLPHWIQTVADYQHCAATAVEPLSPQQHTPSQRQQQQQDTFKEELARSALHGVRLGKDIIDPFETFGYYAGLDFIQQPGSIVDVLQSCGFLPGQELVVAAQHAQHHGVGLQCIDAPVKLQEAWVKGLVSSFTAQLDEATINSYQPVKDFSLNQQLVSTLPAAAAAYDQQLADTAAQLQQQAAAAAAAAVDAAAGDKQQQAAAAPDAKAAEQQALLLFKVSKATIAALLPPDAAQQSEVLGRMQRLQPLKWRHFQLRQQHMAQKIKEAAVLAVKQSQRDGSNSSSSSGGDGGGAEQVSSSPVRLLVVVGRQHVAALCALLGDLSSGLWRTEVSRSFAPSVVEPLPARPAQGQEGSAA